MQAPREAADAGIRVCGIDIKFLPVQKLLPGAGTGITGLDETARDRICNGPADPDPQEAGP